jgi:hypothetical protein
MGARSLDAASTVPTGWRFPEGKIVLTFYISIYYTCATAVAAVANALREGKLPAQAA